MNPVEQVKPNLPSFFPLDPAIHQDMTWCSHCGGERVFLMVYEFEGGRVGCCLGCGDDRVVPFTRTTSEAA